MPSNTARTYFIKNSPEPQNSALEQKVACGAAVLPSRAFVSLVYNVTRRWNCIVETLRQLDIVPNKKKQDVAASCCVVFIVPCFLDLPREEAVLLKCS